MKRESMAIVLPVIYGNRFVARFEPEKITSGVPFAIKSWYWEPGIEITDECWVQLTLQLADLLSTWEFPFAKLFQYNEKDRVVLQMCIVKWLTHE